MKTIYKLLFFYILFIAVSCKKDPVEKASSTVISNAPFNNERVNCIFSDSEGTVWVGTQNGIYSFAEQKWTQYTNSILAQEVLSIEETHHNIIYLGTNNGIVTLEKSVKAYEPIQQINTSNSKLASDTIFFIKEDEKANIWFGTDYGLSYYDGTSFVKNVMLFLSETRYTSMSIVDNQYFVTTLGRSLFNFSMNSDFLVDGFSGASQMICPFNGDYTDINVYCSMADSKGYLWFGTAKGLTRNKNGTYVGDGEFAYFLGGEKVLSLLESANGDIWVGKESGVSVFDGSNWTNYNVEGAAKTVTFALDFTEEEFVSNRELILGLADTVITTLTQDKYGNIWFGTPKGVSVYDGINWYEL